MRRIVIFANGEVPDLDRARLRLQEGDYVICADGGTRHALALGLEPDLVIGDMDSTEKRQLQSLQARGVAIELFPHDKNETDLELALRRALEREPEQVIVIGALGGRLDQTLANIALLTDPRLASVDLRLDDGREEVLVCHDQDEVHGRPGDLVSLIPWGGPVTAVHTQGLKWPLRQETLYPHMTRGVSNEMLGETATISIGSGLLLVVHRRKFPEGQEG